MAGEEIIVSGVGDMFLGIILGVAMLILIVVAVSILIPSKSKQYRKYIADMYVAAKIRFLAKKDDLDIVSESEDFKVWSKKQRLETRDYDLDNTIEQELKESISTPVKKGVVAKTTKK